MKAARLTAALGGILAFAATGGEVSARTTLDCPEGCTISIAPYFDSIPVDYTLYSDGQRERWTFRLESDDPSATVELDGPNQIDTFRIRRDEDGEFNFYFGGSNPFFIFDQTVLPHLTTIDIAVRAGFNTCGPQTPIGEFCAEEHFLKGNGTSLRFRSTASVTVFTSYELVPEPATWAMMVGGFGLLGGAARRQRRAPGLQG